VPASSSARRFGSSHDVSARACPRAALGARPHGDLAFRTGIRSRNGHDDTPRLSVPVYTAAGIPQPIRRRLRLALRLETLAPGTSLIPEHEEDR
jgi:hypothetical protein